MVGDLCSAGKQIMGGGAVFWFLLKFWIITVYRCLDGLSGIYHLGQVS